MDLIQLQPKFPVQITEAAAKQLKAAMSTQELEGDLAIRAGIQGGGCSGFLYQLNVIKQEDISDFDHTDTQYDILLVVDHISTTHIKGTTIDFINDLNGYGFKFINPNAQTKCGCNKSFSV